MNLKRLVLALMAVGVLTAFAAGSASAATMVPKYQWYTGATTTTLPVGSSKVVSCSTSGTFVLTGSVGENHVPVKLTATGIECIGASLFNEGSPVLGHDKGKLKFKGVTVDEPVGCEVEGGAVETNELKTALYAEEGVTGKVFDKYEPAAGATGNFATVHLIGSGCSVSGAKVVKGTVYGEAAKLAGEAATTQTLNFSSSIDTTTGGALTFAGNEAHLTGSVVNSIGGEAFGAK
jgi:hypothetical protein